MAEKKIIVEPFKVHRDVNGEDYILTKIDYTEEDAKADEAWQNERGTKPKLFKEAGFWLVYTKTGAAK